MIRQIYRVGTPRLPLKSYQDFSAFKLYMHDVGLLGAMSGVTSQTLLLKGEIFSNFKGALGEQFALQELTACGFAPSYWTSDSGNAEVEFIFQGADEIIPLEVKAGHNAMAKSLGEYLRRYDPRMALRTTLNSYRQGTKIVDAPLYALASYLKTIPKGETCTL